MLRLVLVVLCSLSLQFAGACTSGADPADGVGTTADGAGSEPESGSEASAEGSSGEDGSAAGGSSGGGDSGGDGTGSSDEDASSDGGSSDTDSSSSGGSAGSGGGDAPSSGDAGDGGSGGDGTTPGGGGCVVGGCSSQLCVEAGGDPVASTCEWREEYACYRDATCERQPDGQCDWTLTDELSACLERARGGASNDGGELRWYRTCGDPVCGSPNPSEPDADPCTTEQEGARCSDEGATCDPGAGCGVLLLCTDSDPTMQVGGCPISRARYKADVEYLGESRKHAYHEQLMSLPLAEYRYRQQPQGPRQLGFIIEDIEPSVATRGDRVNLYGYLSMAVAAMQVQSEQIQALEREVDTLRAQLASDPLACTP